jgi:hypothetical protein
MNCSSCGQENAASVSFCEFCGVDLRKTVPTGAPIPAGVPSAPDAAAAAAVLAQASKSLFKSLTLGEKFSAIGAAAAIIGFFLPFVSSPDLGSLSGMLGQLGGGSALNHVSYSLLDLAKLLGAVYFILLAAIGSAVLFYFSRSAILATKLLMNGFQVMIGSLFGPLLIVQLLFIPLIQSVAGIGYWMTGLGYCAVAAGGLIAVAQLAKQLR